MLGQVNAFSPTVHLPIDVFRTFPRTLFRVNHGAQVQLVARSQQRRVFDICPTQGWVKPLALDPASHQGQCGEQEAEMP